MPPKSNGQKWRKVPFQPNGKPADTTDRSTWNRFEECCAAYARGRFDGLGFVFDGEIGADGLCYCGVDFDGCIENGNIHSLARSRIKQLDTYTELSVSGTGLHCITRAKLLDRIVKFDGVEIYTSARYFTFTGRSFGQIKPAPTEISALVDEVRAKEAATKQQQRSGLSNNDPTDPFKDGPAKAFAALDPQESLADGIKTTRWFETLSPEMKDEVVDHALGVIAKNTRLLELEADGGNNAEYYKLTTSVARSGAPNAEDIFVKHASSAKNADPNEALRQHFSRCCASQPSGNREITVGTLLLLAQQNGANFDQWKCQLPGVPPLEPSFVDPYAEFVGPAFPLDVLPPTLSKFVDAEHRAMGADPSAIAMAALTTVAGAMHAETAVRAGEGWWERPILWTALVGQPSTMKSPIIEKTKKPLSSIDQERNKRWRQEYAIWRQLPKATKVKLLRRPSRFVASSTTPRRKRLLKFYRVTQVAHSWSMTNWRVGWVVLTDITLASPPGRSISPAGTVDPIPRIASARESAMQTRKSTSIIWRSAYWAASSPTGLQSYLISRVTGYCSGSCRC